MLTLIVTDNPTACRVARQLQATHGAIEIRQTLGGPLPDVPRVDVQADAAALAADFGLVLSIQCKQLFPPELVHGTRCVNVHPGLNPWNRGWFPQVFAILNGLPVGVTIHEIDEELDHGPIIVQQACEVWPWDTSASVYARIMALEEELLLEHFVAIRDQRYTARAPGEEGNLNRKADYEQLLELDLEQTGRFGAFLDRLRALSHAPYWNAYFRDAEGGKVFVRVQLQREEDLRTKP